MPPPRKATKTQRSRKALPTDVRLVVLTEAGWRCGVPTCRMVLALDLHHLVVVSEGGSDGPTNLIALCPTCHALYHRGDLTRDALYTYKAILIALSNAFDIATVDQLLFLHAIAGRPPLQLQGQGVLAFMRLVAAGLADFKTTGRDMGVEFYAVSLTPRGESLIEAWKSGNRQRVAEVIARG